MKILDSNILGRFEAKTKGNVESHDVIVQAESSRETRIIQYHNNVPEK